ncbi:DNA-directed RNA polymerase specialized sigma subunit, sigma24 [Chthonomonas calidirosea]|uniref:RNA polymerase sigma factor n=1 Tax=Chthonomonas calidirosea TaxID=454171 RepID=UPI0006DD45E2|nr:hypothetical protein [Chthonomonas calidirosea]CEK18002.1 DNA-directed RNA polymerase specialized sigma subunit, sigma24 [Chthonomonas calidirosea]
MARRERSWTVEEEILLQACSKEAIGYCVRCGLCLDDAQDCAASFIEKLLRRRHLLLNLQEERYRHRALRRFFLNWQRDQQKRLVEEQIACAESMVVEDDSAAHALLLELWQRLEGGLAVLTASQRHLIRKHLIEGYSFEELVQSAEGHKCGIGSSPDAMRKAYQRALQQLRRVLERQGLSKEEAFSYISLRHQVRGEATGIA